MYVKLRCKNFFNYYILHCDSKTLSPADRTRAKVMTWALAILTLGIAPFLAFIAKTVCLNPRSSSSEKVAEIAKDAFHIGNLSPEQRRIPHTESDDPLQQIVESRGLSLHVCPKKPAQSYPPKRDKIELYLSHFDQNTELYRVAKKAIENIQHISMEKFETALKACVIRLNHQLLNRPYSIGLVHGKSNQWVASLALKNLTVLPTSEFTLGSGQGTLLFKEVPKAAYAAPKEEVIVLFDDASWSGSQLRANIEKIGETCEAEKKPRTVFVVVPFMTNQSLQEVEKVQETFNYLHLEIITGPEKIRTNAEIFSEAEARELGKLLPQVVYPILGTTLCYTDWRLPDNKSFLDFFGFCRVRLFSDPFNPSLSSAMGAEGMLYPVKDSQSRMINPNDSFIEPNIPRPYSLV